MSLKSLRTQYIEAFEAIIPVWQEIRSACGGLDAMNYGQNDAGKATNTVCSAVVRPSKSDFVADVELAARRALSPQQLKYFNSFYKDQYGQVDDIPAESAELDLTVRETLGGRLMAVGIFPRGRYFAAFDTRGGGGGDYVRGSGHERGAAQNG